MLGLRVEFSTYRVSSGRDMVGNWGDGSLGTKASKFLRKCPGNTQTKRLISGVPTEKASFYVLISQVINECLMAF
jgi:hypothetical protein